MQDMLKALLSGLLLFYGGTALAYEEPSYQVIKTYSHFELRQYEPYLVAETYVTGEFSDVGSQAFRRLFDYIREDQRPQGKIDMTTPVIQQPVDVAAAKDTDRDDGTGKSKRYRFAFVMPAKYELASLPIPESADVVLHEVPGRLMAARQYSGTWSEKRYRENEKILLTALQNEGLVTVGEPVFARYNAPFSLWFLRRNEVLIEVQSATDP